MYHGSVTLPISTGWSSERIWRMGYLFYTVETLCSLVQQGILPKGGRVLELGSQDIFLRNAREIEALNSLGAELFDAAPLESNGATFPAALLYRHWGFDYECVDVDGREGTIYVDFHDGSLPSGIAGNFDLVTNHGTTEHVLDVINAFAVIHAAAREAGIMWHAVPASGFGNHGFLNVTPKFWHALIEINGYEVISSELRYLDTDELGAAAVHSSHHDYMVGASQALQDRSSLGIMLLRRRDDRIFFPPLDFYDWRSPTTARMLWSAVLRYKPIGVWPKSRLRAEVNAKLESVGADWRIGWNSSPVRARR